MDRFPGGEGKNWWKQSLHGKSTCATNAAPIGLLGGFPMFWSAKMSSYQTLICGPGGGEIGEVAASRRPVTGVVRVRGDRGRFVRAGRRLAVTLTLKAGNGWAVGAGV